MGCVVFVLAMLAPRITMVFILLLTDWFQRAYETLLFPLLGFFFMPYTTLVYMGGRLRGGIRGLWLALLVVAVVVDLMHWAGGGRHYRVYSRGRTVVE